MKKPILLLIFVPMAAVSSVAIANSCHSPVTQSFSTNYQFQINNQSTKTQTLSIYGVGYNNDQQFCKTISVPPGQSSHEASCLTSCWYGETQPFIITPDYANYDSWENLVNGNMLIVQKNGVLRGEYN